MQTLSQEMSKELSSLPFKDDLIASLDTKVNELKVRLEGYHSEYNKYAAITSNKLVLEISKTAEGMAVLLLLLLLLLLPPFLPLLLKLFVSILLFLLLLPFSFFLFFFL